ncbi:MAG: T9SS C-terminal target domain-containing protein [Candidatus Zixiibacteriota bacterium]|nr:MAG: T9SS C-terminal target domain-containing protein [candidate division Zixibacteria bacterium]
MRISALILALSALAAAAAGQPVSGPVSGVWTAAHGLYEVVGDIYIPAGDTLKMMPGTQVQFQGQYALDIQGVLWIAGAPGDSVVIYYASSFFYYAGITVTSTQSSSRWEYAKISGFIINLGSSPTTIEHSRLLAGYIQAFNSSGNIIHNCYIDGKISGGANWTVTESEIRRTMYFNGEIWPAIAKAVESASGTFMANVIYAYASNNDGAAYAVGFSSCGGIIAHNIITANAGGGLGDDSFGTENCSATIRHNCIDAGDYGIYNCAGPIYNNTIINTPTGIYFNHAHDPVKNCIISGCNTACNGSFQLQYSDVYNCPTPFTGGATAGIGTIQVDPLLVNTWYLSPNSPCIDAGDPDPRYNDPDGTRDDMGANYFDQSGQNVAITLTPLSPPIQIPASGGSFSFDAGLSNAGTVPAAFQAWIMQRLPDGSWQGPMLGPLALTLPAGANLSRNRMQQVPGSAATGTYWYGGYVGTYPSVKLDSSGFEYVKLTTGDGQLVEGWANDGESFAPWLTGAAPPELPQAFTLHPVYPNPFNPATTIRFDLPQAGHVRLEVFDTAGRRVSGARHASPLQAGEAWYPAGSHEVRFNGTGLPSGVYLVRLNAGDFVQTRKLVLLK